MWFLVSIRAIYPVLCPAAGVTVAAAIPAPDQQEKNMSEHIHHVTDDTFEPEVLQADKPVLVDYWAEWCGPCKMIAPLLDDIAKDYAGKLKVTKLNIDENQSTPPNTESAAYRP